jgi:2-keto-4-pentenoate hydratase/2-oxohepta-3-ene-1,7-dioic acid hydratase in catechol pathway
MRFVRYREVDPAEEAAGTGLAVPVRPRLGLQYDAGADGRGGSILPLDALPGIGDDQDRSRALGDADLAAYFAADTQLTAARAGLERLPDPSPFVVPATRVRLLAPVHRPGKIVGVGHNYREHVEEQSLSIPERPLLFAKWANAIVGDGEAVIRHDATHALDLEAELAVVIGDRARRVPEMLALSHVAGWTATNDITARDLQGQKPALGAGERGDGQWARAKSSDTFLPMGPAVVTLDEIPDVSALAVRSWLTPATGERVQMQDGTPRTMIFSVPQLIAFISSVITLEPGDIILTGTPSGVGVFRDPPVFLAPGDVVSVEVSGIGRLDSPIVAHDETVPQGSPAAVLLGQRR